MQCGINGGSQIRAWDGKVCSGCKKKKKKVGPACRKHGSEVQTDSPTAQEVLHKFLKLGSICSFNSLNKTRDKSNEEIELKRGDTAVLSSQQTVCSLLCRHLVIGEYHILILQQYWIIFQLLWRSNTAAYASQLLKWNLNVKPPPNVNAMVLFCSFSSDLYSAFCY